MLILWRWLCGFGILGILAEAQCPSSCYCDDDYVSCVGDGLMDLPEGHLATTLRLDLRNYNARVLTRTHLDGLGILQELKLQQIHINYLEDGLFESLKRLQRLDLSQNQLRNISSEVFHGLTELHYLDLSSNYLSEIEGSFVYLINLEQLNLRENNLTSISARTFYGLVKIQHLNLDSNFIEQIEVGSFQYLTNLAHLILSHNPLKTLSRLDFFGNRLQFIDVSQMGLEIVPQSLTKFVRDLRLAKNNLTKIGAGDFESYPYLGLLVLDDNAISEIENDALGRMEYLMRLWLNGNRLTKVPSNLPSSLRALYIEENLLRSLNNYSFQGLDHLEQLFLQRNQINFIEPCAFCELPNLKNLDLQANSIENLTENLFYNLSSLETLDLSQNNLRFVDGKSFTGMENLKVLQLSRMADKIVIQESVFDSLKHIQILEMYNSWGLAQQALNSTRMLHGLRNLQELNIMHNRIQMLRSDLPSFFPNLKLIKMGDNRWHCNTSTLWITKWMRYTALQFYQSNSITCHTPPNLSLKPIALLKEEHFVAVTHQVAQKSKRLPDPKWVRITEAAVKEAQVSTPESSTFSSSTLKPKLISPLIVTLPTSSTTLRPELFANDSFSNSSSVPSAKYQSNTSSTEDLAATAQSIENATLASIPEESTTLGNRSAMNLREKEAVPITSAFTVLPFKRVLPLNQTSAHALQRRKWNVTSVIIVSSAVIGGFALLIVVLVVTQIYKCYLGNLYHQRTSSISYSPQKDEISIVTVSEGTIGFHTNSHNGLGNKMYFAISDEGLINPNDDPQMQEFIPCDNGSTQLCDKCGI